MNIIEKDVDVSVVRGVDWSKPLVEFIPWPFHEDQVALGMVAYWDGYEWHAPEEGGWVIDREHDNVLGTTTLGETFVSSRESLDKLA